MGVGWDENSFLNVILSCILKGKHLPVGCEGDKKNIPEHPIPAGKAADCDREAGYGTAGAHKVSAGAKM